MEYDNDTQTTQEQFDKAMDKITVDLKVCLKILNEAPPKKVMSSKNLPVSWIATQE